MKTILQFVLALCLSTSITAQHETIFGNVDYVSGFGGPILEISSINGETVADVGGGGAVIIDRFFFGGYGLGTDAPNININEEVFDIHFRHGGFWMGFTSNPNKVAHVYTSFRIGWGEANLKDGEGDKRFSDNILVLEPELGVELNMTSWFKVAFTGGYRWVDGVSTLPGDLTNDSFISPFAGISFRFGGFDHYDNNGIKDVDFDF